MNYSLRLRVTVCNTVFPTFLISAIKTSFCMPCQSGNLRDTCVQGLRSKGECCQYRHVSQWSLSYLSVLLPRGRSYLLFCGYHSFRWYHYVSLNPQVYGSFPYFWALRNYMCTFLQLVFSFNVFMRFIYLVRCCSSSICHCHIVHQWENMPELICPFPC